MSNIIVMAFSPRNIVGCLLKKGLQKDHRHPRTPPRYALEDCHKERFTHYGDDHNSDRQAEQKEV